MPTETVDPFAEEWGLIKILSTTLDSIPQVKAFADEIGRTGKWNGDPVGGFAVHTLVTKPPTYASGSLRAESPAKSPYAAGSSCFFKVRFDKSYMMYHDWGELTKKLLSEKRPMCDAKLSKSKI